MFKTKKAHLVWQSGIGREMQRNGSNVLLCFRQWGHVSEDLRKRKHTKKNIGYISFTLDSKLSSGRVS